MIDRSSPWWPAISAEEARRTAGLLLTDHSRFSDSLQEAACCRSILTIVSRLLRFSFGFACLQRGAQHQTGGRFWWDSAADRSDARWLGRWDQWSPKASLAIEKCKSSQPQSVYYTYNVNWLIFWCWAWLSSYYSMIFWLKFDSSILFLRDVHIRSSDITSVRWPQNQCRKLYGINSPWKWTICSKNLSSENFYRIWAA